MFSFSLDSLFHTDVDFEHGFKIDILLSEYAFDRVHNRTLLCILVSGVGSVQKLYQSNNYDIPS